MFKESPSAEAERPTGGLESSPYPRAWSSFIRELRRTGRLSEATRAFGTPDAVLGRAGVVVRRDIKARRFVGSPVEMEFPNAEYDRPSKGRFEAEARVSAGASSLALLNGDSLSSLSMTEIWGNPARFAVPGISKDDLRGSVADWEEFDIARDEGRDLREGGEDCRPSEVICPLRRDSPDVRLLFATGPKSSVSELVLSGPSSASGDGDGEGDRDIGGGGVTASTAAAMAASSSSLRREGMLWGLSSAARSGSSDDKSKLICRSPTAGEG